MVKKFRTFVNEESLKDFEEDVLGETQSEKQIDNKEVKKEVEEKNENI
mgnify:FL=1|jgi:hypothetical protein|tara:strand:+ start:270 stop:413 length:144 start_codon:yes stop_codon:yes gene_type:complete